VVVDSAGVAFKKFPEGGAIVMASSEPKFSVRYVIVFTPHEYIMSRMAASVPRNGRAKGALGGARTDAVFT
jgi:hypothetical protein